MRNKILIHLVSLSFLFIMGGATAHAQVIGEVVANVPFAFTVEHTTLPAGNYVITSPASNEDDLLEIRQENGDLAVLVPTEFTDLIDGSVTQTELVFDRVGTHNFLRQVWEGENGKGEEIQKSKQESRMEQTAGKAQQHHLAATHRKRGK